MTTGGFSDAERERVRGELVDAGRELFARYGLDSTTIADLVEPAGIAPSTFYRFFDSKERLCLEILESEGEAFVRGAAGCRRARCSPRPTWRSTATNSATPTSQSGTR